MFITAVCVLFLRCQIVYVWWRGFDAIDDDDDDEIYGGGFFW